MFHTYVLAYSGKVVDFDRASYLMDQELLTQSKEAMRKERVIRPFRDDIPDDSPFSAPCYRERNWAQWVWDDYCERHYEAYGEFFVPDANPNWDS
jgi:hypothetical protein